MRLEREKKSSSRLNQRHSFFCLKSRCGGGSCCFPSLKHQVHQMLEAGIVSSRKYFPLYFNSHQKVIHLLEQQQGRTRWEELRKRKRKKTEEEKIFLFFCILLLYSGRRIHKGKKKVTVTDDALKIPQISQLSTTTHSHRKNTYRDLFFSLFYTIFILWMASPTFLFVRRIKKKSSRQAIQRVHTRHFLRAPRALTLWRISMDGFNHNGFSKRRMNTRKREKKTYIYISLQQFLNSL